MTLDLSRIKAICFDVDGTLSDTDDQWISSLEQRLRLFRWMFPRGNSRAFARWAIMCAETPGNLVYHLLDRANLDVLVGRLYNFLSRSKLGKKPRGFWVVNGVEQALCILNQHYPMAIVSARDRAGTEAFLEQFQLQGYFRAVASALTCRFTKPFPDPVIWATAQMGVAPENCLMVGDTTVDIRAGRAAGAQTVGVLCGFGQENELRKAGADLILPSTAMLVETLLLSQALNSPGSGLPDRTVTS
ncbi:MAG: HAD family hydrolase [Anaerolineaceae bacterium]|nr:HAD family hydrolase [Anaerolineaceae bacterium]